MSDLIGAFLHFVYSRIFFKKLSKYFIFFFFEKLSTCMYATYEASSLKIYSVGLLTEDVAAKLCLFLLKSVEQAKNGGPCRITTNYRFTPVSNDKKCA